MEKLWEIILQFIDLFFFIEVLDEYERGIVLRWGRYHRTVGPGLHWKIPFLVEVFLTDNVVTRTTGSSGLTLTLLDGTEATINVITRWRIHDIKKVLLEVEGIDDVLRDCVYAEASRHVRAAKWEDLLTPEWEASLAKDIRKKGWKYGVEIEDVALGDCTKCFPLSLIKD